MLLPSRLVALCVAAALAGCSAESEPAKVASPPSSPSVAPAVPTTTTPEAAIRLHGKAATDESLISEALNADIVYLGEKHDNAEHHALQARVLQGLVTKGAAPTVVFEMVEEDHQSVLDELAKREHVTAADYRDALAWEKSGWPAFEMYAPIFQIAIDHHLPIVAGNAPSKLVKHIAFTGEGAGDLKPLPDAAEHSLEEELAEAHCGKLPADALAPMALAQRVRDRQLAKHASAAQAGTGGEGRPRAVVIAGNGHVRTDRGAPWEAAQANPSLKQFSLSFQERGGPEDASPPYDAVWMTVATPPVDHCKEIHTTK